MFSISSDFLVSLKRKLKDQSVMAKASDTNSGGHSLWLVPVSKGYNKKTCIP